jgi:transcriptional regulator with XRE-family HTH domain
MASIGNMLRAAREAQGRSVTDVAADLCITERYLRAIEEDDVTVLPGLFFYQSFARQYGAMLGLAPKQINEAFAALAAPGTTELQETTSSSSFSRKPPAKLLPPSYSPSYRVIDPIVEGTNRRYFAGYPIGLSAAGLVAAVLLGSGIFAWWSRAPQAAPAVVSRPANVVGPPTASDKGIPAAPVSATTSGDPASGNASPDSAATSSGDDDGNQVVLNLSATERTWLSITSHGKVIFSGVLEPSQSKTLRGGEVATMKIGNAGGVDIQLNGKSIGPIGPRGQVRTVRFTRQDFHVLSPEDEAPAQPASTDLPDRL